MLFWIMFMVLCLMTAPSLSQTKPSCQQKCGDVSIPYPFGVGDDPNCFQDTKFRLFCNITRNPPLLFMLGDYSRPIISISLEGQVEITFWIAFECYKENVTLRRRTTTGRQPGYTYSNTRNKFVAIGCNTQAFISDSEGRRFQSGCSSFCWDRTNAIDGSCSGIGCCETAIPKNVASLNLTVTNFSANQNRTGIPDTCIYAFLADKDWYNFNVSDLFNFTRKIEYSFLDMPSAPVWLDWAIDDITCAEAQRDSLTHACGMNTNCSNSINGPGYLCHCKEGYRGNPYLQNQGGCQDIDECKDSSLNRCERICTNNLGNYTCSCPPGHRGDGIKGGSGCTKQTSLPVIQLVVGIGLGFLFLVLGTTLICWSLQKRKLNKLKEKFFHQNGGILLEQKISSHTSSVETKIFTSEELKAATDNYHESRIVGRGGYGTVYKGILKDGRIVAIKKSKVVDNEQIEQFINEVLILSQVNHRNVVRLLGCCLETEVPLLVYEFINCGTLYHHISEEEGNMYSISWSNRLRIASETAGALAYLHSSASQPIIHRDIKSTNILLDESYTAKIADFGASRLIALDQTQLSTLVQGTMGYLDPEYLRTSLLTDKSDVYSFGVVLVELLTGRKALCFEKPERERNLAMFFVSSLRGNRLFEILDHQVVNEGSNEQLEEVANLATRCLRLSSEERPTMKEVAMELEGMRIAESHAWIEHDPEENANLLSESGICIDNGSGYNSMKDQVMHSLHSGR